MTRSEIDIFIDTMEDFNDIWEPEDVERVYGHMSLEDALADRQSDMAAWANIMGMVINGIKRGEAN